MSSTENNIIAKALKEIGTIECVEKADLLDGKASPISMLHLRNLNLTASDVQIIANALGEQAKLGSNEITSISFSYNKLLGDEGVIVLIKNMPKHLQDLGLVNCGIGDIGGMEILKWMKGGSSLRMICMEQNNFSDQLKIKFRKFASENQSILLVI